MTLKEAMQEKYNNHDCHLSMEDSCSTCEEYCAYKAMSGRSVKDHVFLSGDNFPPQSHVEKYDNDTVGGATNIWIT